MLHSAMHLARPARQSFHAYASRSRGFLTGLDDIYHRSSPRPGHKPKVFDSAEEAVAPFLKTDGLVFIHGGAATPQILIDGMLKVAKGQRLKNLRTIHIGMEGPGPLPAGDEEAKESIVPIVPFAHGNLRKHIADGHAKSLSIHLYDLPRLFRRKVYVPDVALIHVSPPDAHGYCTLGTSVDWTRCAVEHSKAVVGLVNPQMPRVHGDGAIHYSRLDAVVNHSAPIHVRQEKPLSREEVLIGQHIASLTPDGATLQAGIGSIPDAAFAALNLHKNLGVHTEMFGNGILSLVKTGVIDNSRKSLDRGKIVSAFCLGNQELYDFVNDNVGVSMRECSYTNDHDVIASQSDMVVVNACIEMDLTGQSAAGSIGPTIYSGFGGQVDFLRAASLSKDGRGKSILAVTSRTKKGIPRIVPTLKEAAGVVTSRATVNYVVTEYGIADLFGKTMPERAAELIGLAHPDDREALERAAFERFGQALR